MSENQKALCVLPWIHASIGSSGKVFPCCKVICFEQDGFGNLHQNNLDDVRNNQRFREFREMMLNGQSPLICKGCYSEESSGVASMREGFGQQYASIYNEIIQNRPVNALPLKYGEVRFSNKCNLACRTCSLDSSSSWHRDHVAMYGSSPKILYSHPNKEQGILDELENHLDTLDMIYFAGGEPLLEREHYTLLEMLIRKNRTNTALVYNTNMTRLNLGDRSVLELWNKFSNVKVLASIDGIGERYELIRHGEEWSTVEKNILLVKHMLPHVRLVIFPTISVLNVCHLKEIAEYSLAKKFISNLSFFKINHLFEPDYYQANSLPDSKKQSVVSDLYAIASRQEQKAQLSFSSQVRLIEETLMATPRPGQRDDFKKMTLKLDELRGESTSAVCPELAELLI